MTTSTHTCSDEEVMSASKKALESGRITPLLKVELWAKIQSRRLSEGKEELRVDFEKSPHSSNELTKDEQERARGRRASNRVAARKCRGKKKQERLNLDQLKDDLEVRNQQLRSQVQELEQEKIRLTEKLLGNVGVFSNHLEEPVQIPAISPEMTINTACIMTEFNNCDVTSVNMLEMQVQQETYEALDVEVKTDSNDTIEYSRGGEQDDHGDIEDLTYFRSSQEVPTGTCSDIQMEERAPTNNTSPLPEFEDGEASLDDWMGTSYISLDKYIL
ncbi:unnamed protein product [Mytilus coruscus]|uniref:BZIP domain-containing protein n=1 Tax=Mytilus coruscus TaxID=42192 RepID=A0A6J8D691_MYTCO|nr:unnamed protein product [Mytilus coruscus]